MVLELKCMIDPRPNATQEASDMRLIAHFSPAETGENRDSTPS
jgi:hypothetical protein